jgi:hypothetical protein
MQEKRKTTENLLTTYCFRENIKAIAERDMPPVLHGLFISRVYRGSNEVCKHPRACKNVTPRRKPGPRPLSSCQLTWLDASTFQLRNKAIWPRHRNKLELCHVEDDSKTIVFSGAGNAFSGEPRRSEKDCWVFDHTCTDAVVSNSVIKGVCREPEHLLVTHKHYST